MSSNSISQEISHYVVTAHPPGAVLLSTKCNFLAPNSMDVLVAKSGRLEVRQLRASATAAGAAAMEGPTGDGVDSFPVVLQLPINGRLTALEALKVPSLPTSAIFMLLDRNQYAVISYVPKPLHPIVQPVKGQLPQVTTYPVFTHSHGSLETGDLSRANETGTLVAVDPHFRCIALHCFDGMLSILPVDPQYIPPAASISSTSTATTANPRRPKQLLGNAFHCRMEEHTILALTFLHTTATNLNDQPPLQLAVLYQDARGSQHVTTHVINLPKKQMHFYGSQSVPVPVQWLKKSGVDGGSSILIPVQLPLHMAEATAAPTSTPHGDYAEAPRLDKPSPAVIVIGQRQFTYCCTGTTKIIPVPQALFLAYTELPRDPDADMPRYLLADELSNLHMLSIVSVSDRVTALQLETLGSCALASTLCYLRDGLLYVGSGLGDSQLIQISDEPIAAESDYIGDNIIDPDGPDGTDVLVDTTYLTVVEEYTNLGPILDFDLVPTAPKGAPPTTAEGWQQYQQNSVQSQVVTASGTSKSGSIRVVRNGIGMNEYAAVEIPGIQAMWSLRKMYDAREDTYLVQSFVGETRVLGVIASSGGDHVMENKDDTGRADDEEDVAGTLEEVLLSGLDSSASSLYVGNVQGGDRFLQITGSEIRLLSWSGSVLSTWQGQITVAVANEAGQIVVALEGGVIVYFTIENDQIQMNTKKQMDREVSCVDIHPFTMRDDDDESTPLAMDVDSETRPSAPMSALIAVGMWDDFTVRLLSINSGLLELVCINLSTSEDDEDLDEQGPVRRNRNNMMARSLCLVTLDFASVGGQGEKGPSSPGVNMLFIGLGDGTLVSFAVVSNMGTVTVQSKKEVSLGTQRIDLVPLNTEQGGTCVLATGDRPTVIYLTGVGGAVHLSNPKLCYSNVNVAANNDEEQDDVNRSQGKQTVAVNVAAPFFSPLLFDADSLGKQHYSLCVADDTSLRLGVIDDIQKLHVTTCRLGMAPRRIVHCVDGRLFAVGCIESGIQNFGLGGDEANMGNCIRFMDDTTFDDLERFHLDPYEMILSMIYVSLKVPVSVDGASTGLSDSAYKPFLLVGTAYALPDEDEPTRGRILVYSCQEDESTGSSSSNRRAVRQITELSVEGGVYSMCLFYDGNVLATVNTRTHVCQLVEDTGLLRLQYVGLGHFGHILSLFVKSRAHTPFGGGVGASADDSETLTVNDVSAGKGKNATKEPEEMLAIVGDLMRSISLVQYYPQHQTLEEVARDFNANWTCAVEMLNDDVYLGAENWHNLFCLRRNTATTSEEMRCRLDTIGEYHLGEMCNKFMAGSLVMPASSNSPSNRRQVRRDVSPNKRSGSKDAKSVASRVRRPVVSTGSQTLFGTVDGTLGVVMGLDARTTAFFSTLERSMANVIRHVGDFGHSQYRACYAERRVQPAHGFIDGDLVESFLDLDRVSMDVIVTEMNRDGNWDATQTLEDAMAKRGDQDEKTEAARSDREHDLTVDDVLAMVEEITMLH